MRRLNRVRILSITDKALMLDLKSVIARFVPDATVILYGSAARGKRGPESDYDLLVLSDRKLSSKEEAVVDGAVYDLELDRDVVLAVTFYSQTEWRSPVIAQSPYYENVVREGIVL